MPESIKVIVFSFRGAEDMHDNIAVINKNPAGVGASLVVMGQHAFLL